MGLRGLLALWEQPEKWELQELQVQVVTLGLQEQMELQVPLVLKALSVLQGPQEPQETTEQMERPVPLVPLVPLVRPVLQELLEKQVLTGLLVLLVPKVLPGLLAPLVQQVNLGQLVKMVPLVLMEQPVLQVLQEPATPLYGEGSGTQHPSISTASL